MSLALKFAITAVLGGVLAGVSPALAAIRIGETQSFSLNDIDKIGTINGLLDAKLGHEVIATGGTITRVTENRFLFCGYYTDREAGADALPGFVIVHDHRNTKTVKVLAPLTHAEQERHGCWPSEQAWMQAETARILRMAKRSKGATTSTGVYVTSTTATSP